MAFNDRRGSNDSQGAVDYYNGGISIPKQHKMDDMELQGKKQNLTVRNPQ